MRNLDEYENKYIGLPFESKMVEIRRGVILDIIEKFNSKSIVEIGCGYEPIFMFYKNFNKFIVVEPAIKFYQNAKILSRGKPSIKVLNNYVENCIDLIKENTPDMIILSGLLHEVTNPKELLESVKCLCDKNTIIHLNVPNANSLHRLLAYEIGLINDVTELSETQKKLQQNNTFDIDTLKSMCIEIGYKVIDSGSYFVKPFTHEQMQILLNHDLFGEQIIEGLVKLEKYVSGLGAEIYLNLKKI